MPKVVMAPARLDAWWLPTKCHPALAQNAEIAG